MTAKIIECVPNVSEGQNKDVIDTLANVISKANGVTLLHTDIGEGANRTVFTFIGSPESVSAAAFSLIARASELIDMNKHKGAHPRIGAVDVCPFIPLENTTMEESITLAHSLGKKVADQLSIPVFFYERAALVPERRILSKVRRGEFEKLWQRPDPPDIVPHNPKLSAGATIIGARDFLIAYNVTLAPPATLEDAKRIAVSLRSNSVRAIGWFIPEYNRYQVSFNLVNYKETSMLDVFNAVSKQIAVESSEIIGMIPKELLVECDKLKLTHEPKTVPI